LTNEEGAGFLGISAASIGLAAGSGFSARVGSLKALTFGGVRAIDIPPGAPVVSDPVALAVVPGSELDVSILPSHAIQLEPRGGSGVAVGAGDQTLTSELQGMRQMTARPIVTGIAVIAPARTKVVAALGDSITDGNRLVPGQLHGWPEELARRLTKRASNTYTVVNAGIGGNRVLQPGWGPAALARLDRDVLRIDGLSHLIVLEGINDIGMAGNTLFGVSPAVTADELIAAYRQIIARAHARNVKVGFATLTPFDGSFYASDEKERIRATVNRWIRASGEPDFVIGFDNIMADPKAPRRLRKDYDSGDHLHPSDVGYRAMGDAIDLSVFR
jgi:lysophospholipase L1-like esterase